MEGEGIVWRGVPRRRGIPGDDYRRMAKGQPRRCQGRHVKNLAEMAGDIGAMRVLVKYGGANGKIQQSSASQQRHGAARKQLSRIDPPRAHQN